jgi:hypothetical protein
MFSSCTCSQFHRFEFNFPLLLTLLILILFCIIVVVVVVVVVVVIVIVINSVIIIVTINIIDYIITFLAVIAVVYEVPCRSRRSSSGMGGVLSPMKSPAKESGKKGKRGKAAVATMQSPAAAHDSATAATHTATSPPPHLLDSAREQVPSPKTTVTVELDYTLLHRP